MYNMIFKILQVKIVQCFFWRVSNFENTEISAKLRQVDKGTIFCNLQLRNTFRLRKYISTYSYL